jgi:hypothetical protein
MLLLTRKLLNQGLVLIKLKSSLWNFMITIMNWLTVLSFLYHRWACAFVAVTIPSIFLPVPDLPLYLGVLKHRVPLARGGAIFLPQFIYDGYLLMWCNFKFEGVLFQSDSRHTSFRAQVRGLITELAQVLTCPKSGTAFFHHDRIINTIYPIGATSRAGTAFLSGHLSSPTVPIGVRVAQLIFFCLDHPRFFFFSHNIVCWSDSPFCIFKRLWIPR